MPRPKRAKRHANATTLRLIGGDYRGRRLPIAPIEGLRPTGDRQRETLFNWLQFELPGARVADLYAGTGALGLEAASRGAAHVWLVERQRTVVNTLQEAVATLAAPAEVVSADALAWLNGVAEGCFDGVFIDPPFADRLWADTLAGLERSHCLASGAFVYVESPPAEPLTVPAGWALEKDKTGGEVRQRLYRAT